MEALGLDMAQILIPALSGVLGAVLTFLATRRQHEVSERTVYIGAVEHLTADLRGEIDRVNADRLSLAEQIEELETRLGQQEETERELRGRVAELEDREVKLLVRIEELERERGRLRADLEQHINGG